MPIADPRLVSFATTGTERLLDRIIRHSIFLERYKTGEARRIINLLERDVFPDLERRLLRSYEGFRLTGFTNISRLRTTKRYARMIEGVDEVLRGGVSLLNKETKRGLLALARSEATFAKQAVKAARPSFRGSLLPPPAQQLRSIVISRPFQGRILREHAKLWGAQTRASIRRQINIGLVNGETTAQMARRIRGTVGLGFRDGVLRGVTKAQAETIVRTASAHVANHAREAAFGDAGVERLRWTAVLDSRTTEICGGLDGRIFDVGKGRRPPAHFNCRSVMTPVLKGDAPPRDVTYEEFLKRQSEPFQAEVLGKGKAEIFRRGKVPLRRFVDAKDRSLTLPQLEALETRLDRAQ